MKISLPSKKYIKVLKQKDNLLFHILLLMGLDSEGNYTITKKDAYLIDEAMSFYLARPKINDNSRRPEDRI